MSGGVGCVCGAGEGSSPSVSTGRARKKQNQNQNQNQNRLKFFFKLLKIKKRARVEGWLTLRVDRAGALKITALYVEGHKTKAASSARSESQSASRKPSIS